VIKHFILSMCELVELVKLVTQNLSKSYKVTLPCYYAWIPGVIKFILGLSVELRPKVRISLVTIIAERCLCCCCCNLIVTSVDSLEAFFTCHKHNLRVLSNRVRQQVILKRGKRLTILRMNLNNHHGYNSSILLFELEINAVILTLQRPFWSAVTKLFAMLCLSVGMEQRDFNGRIFMIFYIWTL